MSRLLNEQDKSSLSQALEGFISAGETLMKAPRYSNRSANLAGDVARSVETAKKIRSEVDPSSINLPENPPDRPDSGRGDFDNSQSAVPKGLTTTHSMYQSGKGERGMFQGQSNGDHPYSSESPSSSDNNGRGRNQARETEANLTPGLSGFPVKRDDTERRGNTFTVDSTSHREAAEGEFGRVDPDVLPGPSKRDLRSKAPGHDNYGDDDSQSSQDDPTVNRPGEVQMDESGQSGPLQGDDGRRYQGPEGKAGGEHGVDPETGQRVNVSVPYKQDMDTTNTGTPGSHLPDNFFAQDAAKYQEMSDADDQANDEARQAEMQRKASTSQKYDSANRVATETYGHLAEKARRAGATANQGNPMKEVKGNEGEGDFVVGNTQDDQKDAPVTNDAGGEPQQGGSDPDDNTFDTGDSASPPAGPATPAPDSPANSPENAKKAGK